MFKTDARARTSDCSVESDPSVATVFKTGAHTRTSECSVPALLSLHTSCNLVDTKPEIRAPVGEWGKQQRTGFGRRQTLQGTCGSMADGNFSVLRVQSASLGKLAFGDVALFSCAFADASIGTCLSVSVRECVTSYIHSHAHTWNSGHEFQRSFHQRVGCSLSRGEDHYFDTGDV